MTRFSRIAAATLALGMAALSVVPPVLAAKAAPTSKVNLNTANVQQLATLPGVGEKLAGRIVEYRQKSGSFKTAQELMNVKGVGERNFAKLQAYIVVGDRDAGKVEAKKPAAPATEGQ